MPATARWRWCCTLCSRYNKSSIYSGIHKRHDRRCRENSDTSRLRLTRCYGMICATSTPLAGCAARWLRRCARNFALNYRRDLLCRKKYEAAFSDSDAAEEVLHRSLCCTVSAETVAFAHLFERDLYALCGQLPPTSRLLFEAFHLRGDAIAEIAYSSGKSPNAVKQSIHRTRLQVRVALGSRGYEVP